MESLIRYLPIVSDQSEVLSRFYQTSFGLSDLRLRQVWARER
ncbi:MAG TPA: hypothetical protein VKU60_01145 [Chloroflexota bacterium]|nr:hypothetical protein [Chloroflexota bacterium]